MPTIQSRRAACWPGGLALILLLGSCGSETSYRVAQLLLHRQSWDSLRIEVQFVRQQWLGSAEPVVPDSLLVMLLSARYDTLYLGSSLLVSIPDARLGDRERLLLEVCGWFETRLVCDQLGLNASPKRIVVEPEVIYPFRGTTARLYYRLHPRLERQRYDGAGWEPLPVHRSVRGYLLMRIAADPQRQLRVPLQSWEGVIELTALPAFSDFWYALQQQFRTRRPAIVTLEVYGGLELPELLATVTRRLRPKTEAERKAEVAHFAGEALRQVVEHLSGQEYPIWLRVESWSFNPLTLQYVVEVSARWREGGWFQPFYELFGVLTVAEDGTQAVFRWVSGNQRAWVRWQQRVGQEQVLPLVSLPPSANPASDVDFPPLG
ncbi:MAG: hypothetical protein Q9M35_11155 [Rhodothermus sp.]|nr:hypothetical protein [Rhodothermus sp.]